MNDKRQHSSEDDVMALARRLDTEVQPGRDLWPGIEAAIGATAGTKDGEGRGRSVQPAPPRFGWFAQAAAVLLLVGASSALTWLAMQEDAATTALPPGGGELAFEPVSGSFGSQYTLGPDFQDARASLVERLDVELERLPEETRAEVEKNVAVIRAAIAEINRALADEPDNVLLQELLISAYSEEIAIMRKVDGITNSVMRRTDI